jgi:flagellar basal-body rod protein FlgF
MQNPSYVSLSSQMARERQMDVIANNMANANTVGYKAARVLFHEYLDKASGGKGVSFVQDGGTNRDLTQGPINPTGNPLDVALKGDGYLSVQGPQGPRYTRNGHLQLDSQNQLTTTEGFPVSAQGGAPIVIPPGTANVIIARDGSISGNQGQIAKLDLVNFDDPQALVHDADGLFSTPDQQPQPAANLQVVQGSVEESNVQPIVEMTHLMEVSHTVTSAKNFLDGENTRQSNAIDKLGKVAA